MFNIFKKIILVIGFIYTIPVLLIVYMKLDSPFIYKFVLIYLVVLLLLSVVFIINLSSNIRKLKFKKIKKLLLKFIVISSMVWVLSTLFFYITTGELRITDNISMSITFGFLNSFGYMLYEEHVE